MLQHLFGVYLNSLSCCEVVKYPLLQLSSYCWGISVGGFPGNAVPTSSTEVSFHLLWLQFLSPSIGWAATGRAPTQCCGERGRSVLGASPQGGVRHKPEASASRGGTPSLMTSPGRQHERSWQAAEPRLGAEWVCRGCTQGFVSSGGREVLPSWNEQPFSFLRCTALIYWLTGYIFHSFYFFLYWEMKWDNVWKGMV